MTPAKPDAPFASVLLIEDEPNLATSLGIALRRLGMPARHVPTLARARQEIAAFGFDLVLLDLTLPDGDGLDFCREIRARGFPGMILMLTARGRLEDRVQGLESGADDYLPKPFAWEELAARIRALSRRRPPPSPLRPTENRNRSRSETETGTGTGTGTGTEVWSLDPKRLRVLGPRGWRELTPLEYKLASHLIGATGEIVSRESLLKEVWGFTLLPKTRTVDHFVGRLRKLFEADPESPEHFITVRGAGYRFVP